MNIMPCVVNLYCGSSRFMCVTFGTTMYYGFQEHPVEQKVWLTIVTMMFISCSTLPVMDWFNDNKYRVHRQLILQTTTH